MSPAFHQALTFVLAAVVLVPMLLRGLTTVVVWVIGQDYKRAERLSAELQAGRRPEDHGRRDRLARAMLAFRAALRAKDWDRIMDAWTTLRAANTLAADP